MNIKTFLLPPVTIPRDLLLRQLLIFFDEIFVYAASEDSCDDNFYTKNHLVKHYAPLPFGDDLSKFRRLIKDIKGNRAEYYSGGLFSLSAAANQSNDNETAVWQLVSDIMSPESLGDKHAKTLLESRLMLCLAEIATSEEEEISRELNKVDQLANSLLDELKDEKSQKSNTPSLNVAVSMNLPKLVRAWAYLFLMDEEPDRPWIAATASLEVFEMLADYYSVNLHEQPIKICSLPLPDLSLDENATAESFLEMHQQWHQSSSVFSNLEKGLKRVSLEGETGGKEIMAAESAWREMTISGRDNITTTPSLDFYLFQGVSLPEIFTRVTRGNQTYKGSDFPPHGIVAVLHN